MRAMPVPKHNNEIIKPAFICSAVRERPSKEGPEKIHRLPPHEVFCKVKERSAGHKEEARIPAAPVEIKTRKAQEKCKYERVGNKTSAGNGICKYYPSYGLVDDIREHGPERYIPVIDGSAGEIPDNEEYSKRYAEMAKDIHGEQYWSYWLKGLLT